MIRNMTRFYGEQLLAPRPTPKLEDHPLLVVRDCLFAPTVRTAGRSSIHNLMPRHAVPTGTHLSWGKTYHRFLFKYENTGSKCRQPFTPRGKVWLSLSRFSRNSCFLDNFFIKNCRNFVENPRNCLVADISDSGRKDRHGPHTVSLFLLKERRKMSVSGVGVCCMKNQHSDFTSRSLLHIFFFSFLFFCAISL